MSSSGAALKCARLKCAITSFPGMLWALNVASRMFGVLELQFPVCSGHSTWTPGSRESQNFISRYALGTQHGPPEVRSPGTTFTDMLWAPNMASRKSRVRELYFPACSGHPTWPPGSPAPENYIYQHSPGSCLDQSQAERSRNTFTSTHWNPSTYFQKSLKP